MAGGRRVHVIALKDADTQLGVCLEAEGLPEAARRVSFVPCLQTEALDRPLFLGSSEEGATAEDEEVAPGRPLARRLVAYTDVVVTSKRALEGLDGLGGVLAEEGGDPRQRYWAVGAATAVRVRSVLGDGYGVVAGEGSGSAAKLAEEIVRGGGGEGCGGGGGGGGGGRRFVWLTGHDRRQDLPDTLLQEGIPLQTVVLYGVKECASAAACDEAVRGVGPDDAVLVVLYSKRGVATARSLVGMVSGGRCGVVAIGTSTGASAREAGLCVSDTAEEPTPTGVAKAAARCLLRSSTLPAS